MIPCRREPEKYMQKRHLDFALSHAISMSINHNKCYESSVSFGLIVKAETYDATNR